MSGTWIDRLPVPALHDPRTVSLDVHRHLRRLIIDNAIPRGAVLTQAGLARVFGVSRTPMREVFRMLQEEGLISTEANQRATVRELDAVELDQLYAARIALESVAVQLTSGRLEQSERDRAEALLDTMARVGVDDDPETWMTAHREFHMICVARASGPLERAIRSHSEQSERYVRAAQRMAPSVFHAAHQEHIAILRALQEDDGWRAAALLAEHLSRTSFRLQGAAASDLLAPATSRALAMAQALERTDQRAQ